ncbi:hypothetical protein [Moorena sp. SIO3H5]|uniref:hypothetical protein n=1 Tax=Moorena TaxID=1155738 RepID=UPI0013BC5BFB|nr:hypothetical protein [Moorena sp. SIO3H5]NEO47654.1 hypothetical protein [Moorena sp. SIO4A3]NEO72539.1 hypothetical protein [Moorena sp. SIO3H5]
MTSFPAWTQIIITMSESQVFYTEEVTGYDSISLVLPGKPFDLSLSLDTYEDAIEIIFEIYPDQNAYRLNMRNKQEGVDLQQKSTEENLDLTGLDARPIGTYSDFCRHLEELYGVAQEVGW